MEHHFNQAKPVLGDVKDDYGCCIHLLLQALQKNKKARRCSKKLAGNVQNAKALGYLMQSNPYVIRKDAAKRLQDCIAEPSVQTALSLDEAQLPHMPQVKVSGRGTMHSASQSRSRISELLKWCV